MSREVDLTRVELFFHPEQQKRGASIRGIDLEKHLRRTSLIKRCLSIKDAQPWIDNPETYPEKFRDKVVCLWGSVERRHDDRYVACLIWHGSGALVVHWYWLTNDWLGDRPAALREAA